MDEVTHPPPLLNFEDITAAEVETTLESRYNGAASPGMSRLPSQVVKHIKGEACTPLATFLTTCLKQHKPPQAWRQLQLSPLYKGKGATGCADSYRALAVGHPMGKLAAAIINSRLIEVTEQKNLRAKTQAGFRRGYQLEDLVLVVQTLI